MANETLQVLKLLIESKGEKLSIRGISKLRNVNYKTAYTAVKKLEKDGVVKLERLGNTINCSFAYKLTSLVYEAEYERRGEFLKNKDIRVLKEKLDSLLFPLSALIFGSFAKKRAASSSDIDLLVVCEKERTKELESLISLLPLRIHLTVFAPAEFMKMAKSKEFNVVSEAMKNNVILIGIEDYYRMVEHA